MINTRFWFEPTPAEAGPYSLKAQAYIERVIWTCWQKKVVVRPQRSKPAKVADESHCSLWSTKVVMGHFRNSLCCIQTIAQPSQIRQVWSTKQRPRQGTSPHRRGIILANPVMAMIRHGDLSTSEDK
jgi:hypothetical protein